MSRLYETRCVAIVDDIELLIAYCIEHQITCIDVSQLNDIMERHENAQIENMSQHVKFNK